MASIRTNSDLAGAEAEGDAELVLVAVEYTGSRPTHGSPSIRQQGDYPALDSFQRGQTKLVELPSSSLGWWENHADFELHYDAETIAGVLAGANYIPEQVVGPDYNQRVRDKLLDKTGAEPAASGSEYREQFAEIAGVDGDGDGAAGGDGADDQGTKNREDELLEVGRSTLLKVAGSYDDADGHFEDEHDIGNLTHAKQTHLASFLAGKDDAEVTARVERAEMGHDLSSGGDTDDGGGGDGE